MNIKKVSIVVPVYNAEEYIAECLEAIIKQSYKNIEIILINDGSSDKSGEICDRYANLDNRIQVIHNKNYGVSYSRNCGIEIATGEYILFIDSDDIVEKEYVEILIKEIICNKCDVSICGYEKIDIINNKQVSFLIRGYNDVFCGILKRDYYILEPFLLTPWGKLYRTKVIKKYNIRFPEDCKIAEDQIFNYTYLNFVKKYVYINKPMYKYFLRNMYSLTSNRNIENFYSEIKNLKVKRTFLRKNKIANCEEIINENFMSLIGLYLINKLIKYDEFKYYINLLKENINFFCDVRDIKKRMMMFCLKKKYIFLLYCLMNLKNIVEKFKIKIKINSK